MPKGRTFIDELDVKAEIDKTYTKMPYYDVARMTEHLKNKGFGVGEKRIRHYFKEMCISAIYPRTHMTQRNKEHKIYPYLSMDGKDRALDNIFIERLWRSVKYEYLYLTNPATGRELYDGLF